MGLLSVKCALNPLLKSALSRFKAPALTKVYIIFINQ